MYWFSNFSQFHRVLQSLFEKRNFNYFFLASFSSFLFFRRCAATHTTPREPSTAVTHREWSRTLRRSPVSETVSSWLLSQKPTTRKSRRSWTESEMPPISCILVSLHCFRERQKIGSFKKKSLKIWFWHDNRFPAQKKYSKLTRLITIDNINKQTWCM